MQDLSFLIEEIATSVTAIDADDVSGMAALHEHFVQAERAARANPAAPSRMADNARDGGKLLERIILGEELEPQKALAAVASLVTELADLLAAPSRPDNQPPQPVPSAPIAIEEGPYTGPEPDLGSEDLRMLAGEFVGEATGHVEAAEAALLAMEDRPDDPEPVKTLFRAFHTIKGTAGFVGLKQVPHLAHVTENLLDLARQGKIQIEGTVADAVLDAIDRMKKLIGNVRQAAEAGTVPAQEPGLDRLLNLIDELATGKPAASSVSQERVSFPAAPSPAATSEPSAPVAAAPPTSAASDATVKVSTERLDRLINAVGELVIAQAMVEQSAASALLRDAGLSRNLTHLGKLSRELQELSMSMRMVPLHGVFQKMARLARDLTRKSDKQIEFVSTGGDTELDRGLVESIADPLVHMIRNAADHGIEPPEVREKSGKARAGRIELKAYHQGGSVVIEIVDDGKGLVRSKILAKAIERGIVAPDEQLTDQQIYALIFHAGLSTAEKVTDVSGRGVGMDVVKRNIEGLRGRIEIESVEGKGTTFRIRLPLTLAVIDGLVVRVGAERFIIPLLSVEQCVRPTAKDVSTVRGRAELVMIRQALLPVLRLHTLFGIDNAVTDIPAGLVVIVQDNHRKCCLLVDELLGQRQVVIKALGEGISQSRGVAGGAILGDGRVSLILDIPSLLDSAPHGAITSAERTPSA